MNMKEDCENETGSSSIYNQYVTVSNGILNEEYN